jgi:hypothetical protein
MQKLETFVRLAFVGAFQIATVALVAFMLFVLLWVGIHQPDWRARVSIGGFLLSLVAMALFSLARVRCIHKSNEGQKDKEARRLLRCCWISAGIAGAFLLLVWLAFVSGAVV